MAIGDVVKPTLVEISVYKSGKVAIEVRASIEALLTGINSRFKNTQQAPNADAYDELRVLSPDRLLEEFAGFQEHFESQVGIEFDGHPSALTVSRTSIPEAGYPKVPRISTIHLTTTAPPGAKSLVWHYPQAFADNAVRVRQVDQHNEQWYWSQWQWLRDDKSSTPFSLTEIYAHKTFSETLIEYLQLGFKHIIPRGADHVLFVLGLFLFSMSLGPLLWQVTMFTVAHTVTLGISVAGLVSLPAQIVEPLIAFSIAYIAIENIYARRLARHRLALVFAFGLLHGLGFADVLMDFGLPENAFLQTLLSFNLGVELGQLAVLAAAWLLVGFWFRHSPDHFRRFISIPASLIIAATGLFWTVQRIVV